MIAENNQIKFRSKYRIASARLKNYDYSSVGAYFITICAKGREHFFGEINNEKMSLNEIGNVAEKYWREIPKHFPFVKLDEFVVMPNHLHGIVEICRNVNGENNINNTSDCDDASICENGKFVEAQAFVETQHCCVSTGVMGIHDVVIIGDTKNQKKSNTFYQLKSGSLSVIIRSFKSIVSKTVNKQFPNMMFNWQSRFYDRIIRNEDELNRIREYIFNNPSNWEKDKNNAENIFM